MPSFIQLLREIRDTIYPDFVAKYNILIGTNVTDKVDKVAGKELSTNDYTTLEKEKLAALDSSQYEKLSNRGVANGYAPLDSNGRINPSFISSLNTVDIYHPNDEASMLLLAAQSGDIAYRQDNGNSYMLIALPASTLSNWKQLNMVGVSSFNGLIGGVNVDTTAIPEGTNLYHTNERVDDRVAAILTAGTNVSISYDDANGTITISANDTSIQWSEITGKPTDLAGFGITDALVYKDSQTGAAYIPAGTTAQRPVTPTAGYTRFNTDLVTMEVWNGTSWTGVGGGATGGGTDNVFIENEYTITANYTIPAGRSAVSVGNANGDIIINSGVEVTFGDNNSRWVVL